MVKALISTITLSKPALVTFFIRSISTFTHTITDGITQTLTPDSKGNIKLTLTVNVHNDGKVAGKDAVQIYVTAPYETQGKIEKPHVVLASVIVCVKVVYESP